jgi:hypothetical protein
VNLDHKQAGTPCRHRAADDADGFGLPTIARPIDTKPKVIGRRERTGHDRESGLVGADVVMARV